MTDGTYRPDAISRLADWAVSLVSPRRAWLRGHLRRMDHDADYRDSVFKLMEMRGYRAARNGSGGKWAAGLQGPDASTVNDLATLQSRSRQLGCDDPIASGLKLTFTTNVIGTGIVPQARTADEELNAALEAVWDERADRLHPADGLTYGEAQAVKFDRVWEDGGVLIRRVRRSAGEPVWFEIIEIDRIESPIAQKALVPGGSIVKGVEKDPAGVPVAYWIRRAGEGLVAAVQGFDRIDASEVCHLKLRGRPGQTHGVPALYAVVQELRDFDLLILASLKRAQIAACLAVFLKSSVSTDVILDVTAREYGYKLDQTIEPGMIWKLAPDEDIQTLVPNFPVPELMPFVVMLARRIGAALGVSWQIVLKDFSESNYSSARTDLLEARGRYVVLQQWLIRKLLNWEWFTVMEDARLRGDLRLARVSDEDMAAVYWIPNGWRWVDPQREAAATRIELETRIRTLRDVCAGQGSDWRETISQSLLEEKFWHDERRRLGLDPAPYFLEKQQSGVAQPQEPDEPRPATKAGRGLMSLLGGGRS